MVMTDDVPLNNGGRARARARARNTVQYRCDMYTWTISIHTTLTIDGDD